MTSKGVDYFDDQYYVYNRRLLNFIGLWPYDKSSKRLHHVYVVSVICTGALAVMTYLLMTCEMKVELIIELLQLYLPTVCFTAGYYNLATKLEMVKEIFDIIKSDWEKLASEEELFLMRKFAKTSKFYSLTITYGFYFVSGFIFFPSILCLFLYLNGSIDETELTLLIYVEYLCSNKTIYIISTLVQLVVVLLLSTCGIVFYTVYVLFMQHACASFTILAMRINEPFEKKTFQFSWIPCNTYKYGAECNWIIAIIKRYEDITNFAERVKSIYGRTYILQLVMAVSSIGLDFIYFFQIIDSVVTIGVALKNCLYMMCNVFTMFTAFHLGQKLIDRSISVHKACCFVPFYMLPVKTNKLLLTMTIRSMKPCEFSIGGIIITSYELFTKIAKMSFSFATLLYKTR